VDGNGRNLDRVLSYALWKAHRSVTSALDAALARIALTASLVGALDYIDQHPGGSTSDLARYAGVTPQSAADAVSRLVTLGLVERSPHPTHGRIMQLTPTAAGLHALREAAIIATRTETALIADMPPQTRDELIHWINQVVERAQQQERA
jgi:DNA-binding MarR family transcriptional regulator